MSESFPAAGEQESFRHNYPSEAIHYFNESAEEHCFLMNCRWKMGALIISQTEGNWKEAKRVLAPNPERRRRLPPMPSFNPVKTEVMAMLPFPPTKTDGRGSSH